MQPSSIKITIKSKTIVIGLQRPFTVLSWAPFNGGLTETTCIFNHECEKFEENDIPQIFDNVIRKHELPDNSVGLLTGAKISRYQEAFLKSDRIWVHAIATVGLNNARTAGDKADVVQGETANQNGTINLILASNALPHVSGLMEAAHVATMAKTSTMIETGIKSKKSGEPATGTGTDCIVVASSGEVKENYCGMHTVLGEMIGNTVKQVIAKGIDKWPN